MFYFRYVMMQMFWAHGTSMVEVPQLIRLKNMQIFVDIRWQVSELQRRFVCQLKVSSTEQASAGQGAKFIIFWSSLCLLERRSRIWFVENVSECLCPDSHVSKECKSKMCWVIFIPTRFIWHIQIFFADVAKSLKIFF